MTTLPPEARWLPRRPRARWSWFWALPIIALVATLALAVNHFQNQGLSIDIVFQQGYGLKPGDRLRHRGIEVGEVERVEVSPDLKGVQVSVRLDGTASDLAREGSQFWIVRPRLRWGQVSGLDTVVGAKYLAVQPGPSDAPRRRNFVGIETPLALVDEATSEIQVVFQQGHGLSLGDPLRYRGIQVGEVLDIRLRDEPTEVVVTVRLFQNPSPFARPGTRFWIERPQLSVTEIRGLDTLVGGQYVSVIPGDGDGPPPEWFVGLEQAPVGQLPAGGLEILLESSQRSGLRAGVPIHYRGVAVGRIVSVALAGDATAVEARAWIEPQYRKLVCERTRFWNQSGFDVSIGLGGVRLDAEALASVALGSVGMATPEDNAGMPVHMGHRFAFAAEADPAWLAWQPRIAVGTHLLPEGVTLPPMHRAAVSWQVRRLGFRSSRQQTAWVLWLTDHHLVTPASLWAGADEALDKLTLEVVGKSLDVTMLNRETQGGLCRLAVSETAPPGSIQRCELERLRSPAAPEDVVVIEPSREPFPLTAARLTQGEGVWDVDPAILFSPDQNGALVVAVNDGAVLGLVSVEGSHAQVNLIPGNWTSR